jgi:hypothetical protein
MRAAEALLRPVLVPLWPRLPERVKDVLRRLRG